MNTIICSESNIDLKDKTALGHDLEGLTIVDEQTLKDIIENNKTNNTNVHIATSIDYNIINDYRYQKANIGYEDLGNHWMLANEKIKKSIMEGNKEEYIFVFVGVGTNTDYIVLVNIKKHLYDDGSFEKKYNPLTISTIKRMPE